MTIYTEYTHYFSLTLAGDGPDEESAWDNAVSGFSEEPGTPPDCEIVRGQVEYVCDDCGDTDYFIFDNLTDEDEIIKAVEDKAAELIACPKCGAPLSD